MARAVRLPVTRDARSRSPRNRVAWLLVLWMTLAWQIPVASSADDFRPNVWSIQLHGGTFAPLATHGTSPMVGMRYCKHYTPHLYGGLLTGLASVSRTREQPAVGPLGASVDVARATASLVPVMGFLQVNFSERFVVPLAGFGAGYEWLSLSAKDETTGEEIRTVFRNFAWEAYGGVAFRVARGVRLNGEVFYNGGSLERRATDENGHLWLEAVHVNGIGARIGLDMDFE